VPYRFVREGGELPSGGNIPARGGEAAGAATGGLVLATGNVVQFKPRGTDTVPLLVSPGETVRTPEQEAALGADTTAIEEKLDTLAHILLFRMPPVLAKAVTVAQVKAG
jgi:hypothetical protein